MVNRGTFIGTTEPQTQYYQPTIVCAANSGTPTNPSLTTVDGTQYQFGRYVEVATGLVYAEVQCQFLGATAGSTGSVGSGGVYCISLPPEFPARRPIAGQAHRAPIGIGQAYLSFANPAYNVDAIPTIADPWTTLNGTEDQYFQAFIPYVLDEGTFQIAPSTTGITVNHAINYAFNAQDIDSLMPTNGNTSNAPQLFYVTNITTTQFNVNVRQNIGAATNQNGSWRIRADPPTGSDGALLSPTNPWDWNAKVTSLTPFGNLFFMLLYEPQR